MLLLFAGGMLFLLGAQEGDPEQLAAQTPTEPSEPVPALNPGYTSPQGNTIEQILEAPSGVLYAISKHRGFLISFDGGDSWVEHNNGLPHRVIYPFTEESRRVRHLTAVNIDPVNEGRVAVTTVPPPGPPASTSEPWEMSISPRPSNESTCISGA